MAVTSSDGGARPSKKRRRHETLVAGGGAGPAARRRSQAVTSNVGGYPAENDARSNNGKGRYRLPDACRLQGLPEDFLSDAPFTAEGKLKAVANGVPLPMGRAIARAIKEALNQ